LRKNNVINNPAAMPAFISILFGNSKIGLWAKKATSITINDWYKLCDL